MLKSFLRIFVHLVRSAAAAERGRAQLEQWLSDRIAWAEREAIKRPLGVYEMLDYLHLAKENRELAADLADLDMMRLPVTSWRVMRQTEGRN